MMSIAGTKTNCRTEPLRDTPVRPWALSKQAAGPVTIQAIAEYSIQQSYFRQVHHWKRLRRPTFPDRRRGAHKRTIERLCTRQELLVNFFLNLVLTQV
jgi:hypothetical protein